MSGPLDRLRPHLPDEVWFRFNPRGIHGAPHTTRVLIWAATLAERVAPVPGAIRRDELLWAAAVHDVGRLDDGVDRGHGERSAAWVRAALADARPATRAVDLGFVAELCAWHEVPDHKIGRMSLELLVLKDADGLDRCRISDLDPERLRLQQARRLVAAAERLERATNGYGMVTAEAVLAAAEGNGDGVVLDPAAAPSPHHGPSGHRGDQTAQLR
ncbi:MAG: hypothetical protein AVDCRST_MAG73-2587 [uncultured Thermomicrobiales bacterium]|uniref:HD/PDEase domain-containing protein n=1 Tax=uncultured Thermomicrobiales bacterium TaxID=1645740 RepID=A0A6J4UDU7_9BACT|nr:MAG: hypothetical protein AVDCRST_MAG73-2587 [uncultured Thermomicrobiales bacterium]